MTRYCYRPFAARRFFSVTFLKLSFLRFALLAAAVNVLVSCEEDPTKIGYDLLPSGDFVTVTSIDTLRVYSVSMFDRSVATSTFPISYIGKVYDPYFGISKAELVTQVRFRPQWNRIPFTVDSAKLMMKFMTVHGTPGPQRFLKISEVTEQIYTDSAYQSNRPIQADTLNGLTIPLPQLSEDSVNYVVSTIPVDFVQRFFRDTSMFFYSNTRPDYRSSFKGLYFQLLTGNNPLLVSFYTESPDLQNTFHDAYHNFFSVYVTYADGIKDDFQFIIDAANLNASYSKLYHYLDSGVPEKKIQHINDNFRDTLTYIQFLNGVYTKLTIPGLEALKNDTAFDKIAVNKARLTIPIHFDGQTPKSSAPKQLLLRYRTANGSRFHVPDYGLNTLSAAYFDGKIDTVANVYNFNIAGFVQKYFEDVSEGLKPELEVFQPYSGTSSVILKANDSKTPVKFEFFYTKF